VKKRLLYQTKGGNIEMRSMSLSDEERILIIEYRKHDSGTKRSVRILLDMDEPKHTQAEVIPYKIRQNERK